MLPRNFCTCVSKVRSSPKKGSQNGLNFLHHFLRKQENGGPISLHREQHRLNQLNPPSIGKVFICPGFGSTYDSINKNLTIRVFKFSGYKRDPKVSHREGTFFKSQLIKNCLFVCNGNTREKDVAFSRAGR